MDNICLLLGAGVSNEQNLPNWMDLVKDVISYYDIKLSVDKNNLIETIGVVEDDILKTLQEQLLDIPNTDANEHGWARQKMALATRMCLKKRLSNFAFTDVNNNMKLMRSIAEAVYERAKRELITTIVTYNFDDYFEFAYKCILVENKQLSEYEKHLKSYTIGMQEQHLPAGSREKLVNVYHVHGYIPVFDELYGFNFCDKTAEEYKCERVCSYQEHIGHGVIFSGNDYNSLLDDSIVGWTNMIQYVCYSQLPLSVVGFSLTDANFRTLLRRMRKSNFTTKDIMVFLGYGNDEEKELADATSHTSDYLFKEICHNKPDYTIKEFGDALSNSVYEHLKKYLNDEDKW